MKETTRTATELLRAIVLSFIDHPGAVRLTAKEMPGGVYWELQVHPDDMPKACGKMGTHIRAMKFLMAQIGARQRMKYSLKLLEPEPGPVRPASPMKSVTSYDCRKAHELLVRALYQVTGMQEAVEIEEEGTTSFCFAIVIRDKAHYVRIGVPPDDYDPSMTVIGALGTLWRAYAKKEGVTLRIRADIPASFR